MTHRLLELAKQAAQTNHSEIYRYWNRTPEEIVDGHAQEFDTCPHSDCVLVRSAGLVPPPWEDLKAKALDLKARLFVNRKEAHGGCCDDAGEYAVPCMSKICAIEYEAEELLGELAAALPSSPLRSPKETP